MADEDPEVVKRWVERQKATFDFHKHVSSLNTAAMLFFATVLERFKPAGDIVDHHLSVAVFIAFVGSLLVAFGVLLQLTVRIGAPEDPNKKWHGLAVLTIVECFGFVGGLAMVAIYVTR